MVYGTFVPRELSRLRTFLPVNVRAREHNPNPDPNLNPNPGTGELSRLGAKVPLARKFRLPFLFFFSYLVLGYWFHRQISNTCTHVLTGSFILLEFMYTLFI